MTFRDAYKEYEGKSNKALNDTNIFYAFSMEQFNNNKTYKDASDSEYLNVMSGAYIHKKDKDKLDKYFNEILPQLKKDLISKIKIQDLIEYELSNYECYYTGDYTDIFDVVKSYYQDKSDAELLELIKQVFYKNKANN